MGNSRNGSQQNDKKIMTCILLVIIVFSFLIISCGKEETKTDTPQYEGWTKYTYGHFITHFSPASRFTTDKAELAKAFEKFLTEICDMLEMPVSDEKIHLFVYANMHEAKKIVGRETPFSNDTAVHWSGIYPYGYQLTKYLLAKRGIQPSRYDVLNEGIAFLLDFSGINYHDRTNRLVNSGKFIGVSELGDNDAFGSMSDYARRSESASLVAFIMYNYGVDRLFMLNVSLTGWKESMETLFHMEIDDFEKSWLDFAREHSNDPEGTVENDSTRTVRIQVDEQ